MEKVNRKIGFLILLSFFFSWIMLYGGVFSGSFSNDNVLFNSSGASSFNSVGSSASLGGQLYSIQTQSIVSNYSLEKPFLINSFSDTSNNSDYFELTPGIVYTFLNLSQETSIHKVFNISSFEGSFILGRSNGDNYFINFNSTGCSWSYGSSIYLDLTGSYFIVEVITTFSGSSQEWSFKVNGVSLLPSNSLFYLKNISIMVDSLTYLYSYFDYGFSGSVSYYEKPRNVSISEPLSLPFSSSEIDKVSVVDNSYYSSIDGSNAYFESNRTFQYKGSYYEENNPDNFFKPMDYDYMSSGSVIVIPSYKGHYGVYNISSPYVTNVMLRRDFSSVSSGTIEFYFATTKTLSSSNLFRLYVVGALFTLGTDFVDYKDSSGSYITQSLASPISDGYWHYVSYTFNLSALTASVKIDGTNYTLGCESSSSTTTSYFYIYFWGRSHYIDALSMSGINSYSVGDNKYINSSADISYLDYYSYNYTNYRGELTFDSSSDVDIGTNTDSQWGYVVSSKFIWKDYVDGHSGVGDTSNYPIVEINETSASSEILGLSYYFYIKDGWGTSGSWKSVISFYDPSNIRHMAVTIRSGDLSLYNYDLASFGAIYSLTWSFNKWYKIDLTFADDYIDVFLDGIRVIHYYATTYESRVRVSWSAGLTFYVDSIYHYMDYSSQDYILYPQLSNFSSILPGSFSETVHFSENTTLFFNCSEFSEVLLPVSPGSSGQNLSYRLNYQSNIYDSPVPIVDDSFIQDWKNSSGYITIDFSEYDFGWIGIRFNQSFYMLAGSKDIFYEEDYIISSDSLGIFYRSKTSGNFNYSISGNNLILNFTNVYDINYSIRVRYRTFLDSISSVNGYFLLENKSSYPYWEFNFTNLDRSGVLSYYPVNLSESFYNNWGYMLNYSGVLFGSNETINSSQFYVWGKTLDNFNIYSFKLYLFDTTTTTTTTTTSDSSTTTTTTTTTTTSFEVFTENTKYLFYFFFIVLVILGVSKISRNKYRRSL